MGKEIIFVQFPCVIFPLDKKCYIFYYNYKSHSTRLCQVLQLFDNLIVSCLEIFQKSIRGHIIIHPQFYNNLRGFLKATGLNFHTQNYDIQQLTLCCYRIEIMFFCNLSYRPDKTWCNLPENFGSLLFTKKYDLSFKGEYYKKGRLKERHFGRGGGRLGLKGIFERRRFHGIDQERKLQLGEGRKRIIGALKMSLIWSLLFFY